MISGECPKVRIIRHELSSLRNLSRFLLVCASTDVQKVLRKKAISQIDFSFSCGCPVIDHEFRHNIVKVAVDPRGDSRVDPQTTLTML